jgi:hypothetical protein
MKATVSAATVGRELRAVKGTVYSVTTYSNVAHESIAKTAS